MVAPRSPAGGLAAARMPAVGASAQDPMDALLAELGLSASSCPDQMDASLVVKVFKHLDKLADSDSVAYARLLESSALGAGVDASDPTLRRMVAVAGTPPPPPPPPLLFQARLRQPPGVLVPSAPRTVLVCISRENAAAGSAPPLPAAALDATLCGAPWLEAMRLRQAAPPCVLPRRQPKGAHNGATAATGAASEAAVAPEVAMLAAACDSDGCGPVLVVSLHAGADVVTAACADATLRHRLADAVSSLVEEQHSVHVELDTVVMRVAAVESGSDALAAARAQQQAELARSAAEGTSAARLPTTLLQKLSVASLPAGDGPAAAAGRGGTGPRAAAAARAPCCAGGAKQARRPLIQEVESPADSGGCRVGSGSVGSGDGGSRIGNHVGNAAGTTEDGRSRCGVTAHPVAPTSVQESCPFSLQLQAPTAAPPRQLPLQQPPAHAQQLSLHLPHGWQAAQVVRGGRACLRITLPGLQHIQSAAGIGLEVEDGQQLLLTLPAQPAAEVLGVDASRGKGHVHAVLLPATVDVEAIRARFDASRGVLTLTMPLLELAA